MPEAVEAADPTQALAGYISTFLPAVTGNVGEGFRIFTPNLPKEEQGFMPTKALVIAPGGGSALYGSDYLPLGTPLIDFYCYGETHLQADNLSRDVAVVIKQLQRHIVEDVCLCWARIAAEAKSAVDAETLWPMAVLTAQVQYFTTKP